MKIEPIPLGDAAPGVALLFRMSDLVSLSETSAKLGYGGGLSPMLSAVLALDPKAIFHALTAGAKNTGDGSAWTGHPDRIVMPLSALAALIADALSLRIYGARVADLPPEESAS